MDYNKIIIALVIVLVAILVVGMVALNPFSKTDSIVSITSANELYDGDYFSISLTDVNGTPLVNQVVEITIIDANGAENHQQVTTDGSGNGMLQLNGLTPGNYNMLVVYGGNNDYSNSNATQSIAIKKIEDSPPVEQISSEPYIVSTSGDRCVVYWSDGSVTYRGETGEPITKEQYEYYKTYGKR